MFTPVTEGRGLQLFYFTAISPHALPSKWHTEFTLPNKIT